MNNYYVNSCLRWLANELVPYYNSEDLPDALMIKIEKFYKSVSDAVDWFHLSTSDARKLGFLNWDDSDSESCIWFIPSWLFHTIPDGITLYDKAGKEFVFHSAEAPTDVMFGCLTFGVKLEEESR